MIACSGGAGRVYPQAIITLSWQRKHSLLSLKFCEKGNLRMIERRALRIKFVRPRQFEDRPAEA